MLTATASFFLCCIMPWKTICILTKLPIKFWSGFIVIPDLIHLLCIIQAAIYHGVTDGFCIADIFQRILIHHQQVGQFTCL